MSQKPTTIALCMLLLCALFLNVQTARSAQDDFVTVCHLPDTAKQTLHIPPEALDPHLQHGDTLGPCPAEPAPEPPPPQQQGHHGNGEARGDAPSEHQTPIFRGRGMTEHAAVLHFILATYDLHRVNPYSYTFHHENIRPAAFDSEEEAEAWTLREHAACCSMYRYLTRLREARPHTKPGYVDWIVGQLAGALDEDPDELKAALLGHPHAHPHTSDLVRSITATGCVENPSGRQEEAGTRPSSHAEHLLDSSASAESLTIQEKNIPEEIAFAVMNGDAVFTGYGVSHAKEMHLLVMRDDLRHFQHIHPERDADGVWHVPFTPPAGGTYWMYADFIDQDDAAHTIRFARAYDGDPGDAGLRKDGRKEKIIEPFLVTLEVTPYDEGNLFTFHIRDAINGNVPVLEDYLAAKGHGILISAEGDFIHTHPSLAGETLIFHTPKLIEKFYRFFMQFQTDGTVHTVEFDWEP